MGGGRRETFRDERRCGVRGCNKGSRGGEGREEEGWVEEEGDKEGEKKRGSGGAKDRGRKESSPLVLSTLPTYTHTKISSCHQYISDTPPHAPSSPRHLAFPRELSVQDRQ